MHVDVERDGFPETGICDCSCPDPKTGLAVAFFDCDGPERLAEYLEVLDG